MGQEHSNAFTVAKMMDADLLKTVQVKLQQALENGESFGTFSKALIPQLQAAGWWGKKDIVDPLTGLITKAQLGSASRLETIFRSNIQSAYSVGQWDNIQQAKRTAPYLMYDAVDDGRTRPEHAARDGEVHEVDSVFWQSHFPPNGWNCRCGVIQLDKDDMEDMGLIAQPKKPNITTQKWTNPRNGVVQDIPIDTDPGWNVNPGIHRQKQLAEAADSKAQAMLNKQQEVALKKALDKQKLEQIAYEKQIAQDKQLKALMKQQSEASDQISEALTANTPYLASEIKKLQKANPTKDSMSILQAATAKALKSEQNSMVQTWKQSKKKGKKPSAKAEAYVKTLPDEVQASLNAEINAVNKATQEVAELEAKLAAVEAAQAEALAIQKAAEAAAFEAEIAAKVAANNAAITELEKISQGKADVQPGLKKKILDKITSTGSGSQYSVQELLDEVVEQAQQAQDKAAQSSVLSGYKKKVLEGQIPTPKQQQIFNNLDDVAKSKVLADIDKKKGANAATVSDPSAIGTTQTAQALSDQPATGTTANKAPKAPKLPQSEQINLDSLTQIGGQGGSNKGGLYQDTQTGQKWYIKTPENEDFSRNEILTGKLYKLAGVDTPDTQMIEFEGKPSIASKIIDDLAADKNGLVNDKIAGVKDNFVIDAWLANWDVIGLKYDNLLVKNGKAYRVDTGSGLRYRAQGGKKGKDFGNTVIEIETLRDASINPQATSVFKSVTKEDIEAGVARLAKLDDDDIRALVFAHGPKVEARAEQLTKILIARKQDLMKRYPSADPKIKALKLEAAKEVEQEITEAAASVDVHIVAALKGINLRAGEGAMLEAKDIQRVNTARLRYVEMQATYSSQMTKATKDALDSHYIGLLDEMDELIKAGAGTPAKANSGGVYNGWKSAGQPIKVDPKKVEVYIPVEGEIPTFTDAQIKAEMKKTFGNSAWQNAKVGNANLKALSDGDKEAISVYTGSSYKQMNKALRDKKGNAPEYNRARDMINGALAKGKPYKGQCARGISFSQTELAAFMAPIKEAYNGGKPWTDHGYMSSSKGESAAFSGNVILMMDGKAGVDISSISRHNSEREVLFKAGTKWHVTSIIETGRKIIIDLTEAE